MKYTLLRALCLSAPILVLPFTSRGGVGGWVVGWGNNLSGQATGVPTATLPLPPPEQIASGSALTGTVVVAGSEVSNAIAIAAGPFHGLAVLSDGTVAGWGSNLGGQALGYLTPHQTGTNGQVWINRQPLAGVVNVSAGDGLSLALFSNGTLRVWGRDPVDSEADQFTSPQHLEGVVAAAMGYRHALAALHDGTALSWGPFGGLRGRLTGVIAVAASPDWAERDLALQRDGTIMEWDVRLGVPARVAGLSNVVAISSGYGHQLALRTDGTVIGWGGNMQGEATGTPSDQPAAPGAVSLSGLALTNAIAIAAGREYSLALRADGTIAAWGRWYGLRPVPVPEGLTNVVAVAAGPDFCFAITTNSAVAERFGRRK